MERVSEIITNAITSLCNGSWQKYYDFFIFNISNPTETEREIIEYVRINFSQFISKYSEQINTFKSSVDNDQIDNIGLLWLTYCDDNDLFENIATIAHRPRILSI